MLRYVKNILSDISGLAATLAALFFLTGCQSLQTYAAIPDNYRVLFWSQDKREMAFTQMEKYSDVAVISAGETASHLPIGKVLEFEEGEIEAFFETQHLAGLIILRNGEVRFEKYARGLERDTLWSSFSIAKSMTSTLIGAAIQDGYIDSVESELVKYIPELKGTAYDGVTIEHLLTMSTGVGWDENYGDPKSNVAQFIIHKAPDGLDATISYMSGLKRVAPPGETFNYNTGESNLAGVLLAKATGRPVSEYLSEKIWKPYGMEADALWAMNDQGVEIGGCCISARLRDYARFGQFMLDGAKTNGRAVVPENWIKNATTPQMTFNKNRGYGYFWWTYRKGNYAAEGIFGQQMVFIPVQDSLIVTLSNWPDPTGTGEIRRDRNAMHSKIIIKLLLEELEESQG